MRAACSGGQILIRLLRLFFKLLYHQFAWSYDWVADIVSLGRWKKWIMEVIPYLPGDRVLELGFGPGHLQRALHAGGSHPVGLDASRWMAHLADKRLRRQGYAPQLILGTALALPFSEGAFRGIVATFPSEYIFDPTTIAEAYRVLKPGGRLVILPVAWITGKKGIQRIASGLFRVTGQAPEWNEHVARPFILQGFSSSTLVQDLPGSKILIWILERPGETL